MPLSRSYRETEDERRSIRYFVIAKWPIVKRTTPDKTASHLWERQNSFLRASDCLPGVLAARVEP